jgi:hypothetical protein
MYAVVFRRDAWGALGYNDIKEKVLKGERPEFPESIVATITGKASILLKVITLGWQHNPKLRPGFDQIIHMLLDSASEASSNDNANVDITRTLINSIGQDDSNREQGQQETAAGSSKKAEAIEESEKEES